MSQGKAWIIVFLVVVACAQAWAADEFAGLKCGADIPKALVGKRADSNEPVATIEARHKDLGLKNLAGNDGEERLGTESWQICGSEYELLVVSKTGLIKDVIQFPSHSKTSPMFIGRCKAAGKEIPATMLAVLDNSKKYDARDDKLAKTMLNATAAWKVDDKAEKFVAQPAAGLSCPLDGIVTADGGP